MPKVINIDFYRLKMPKKSQIKIEDIFKRISTFTDFKERHYDIDDFPIRLEEFNSTTYYIEGDMTKIRMDNIPPKATIDLPVSPLGLKENEGLGEQNAFLYRPDLQVLIYQSSREGIAISKFCRYIQYFADMDEPVQYEVILEKDAYGRSESLKKMRYFAFNIANVESLKAFETQDAGVKNILSNASHFDSPTFFGILSYGRYTGNLMKNNVLKTAMTLLKLYQNNPDAIKKIQVKGLNEDDEKTVIDMINDKMRVQKKIVDVPDRWYTWKMRKNLLKEAMEEKINDLKILFTNPNET